MAALPETVDECHEYVSWVRNGSVDEVDEYDGPFASGNTVPITGGGDQEYEYVARNTEWTIRHIGTDDCYLWVLLNTLFLSGDDGTYDYDAPVVYCEGGYWGEYTFGFEEVVKRIYPGDSVTISFDQFVGDDQGDGKYIYSLTVYMEFPAEEQYRSITKNFMWNEAQANRIQASITGNDYWSHYSLIRNGRVNEKDNLFDSGKTVTFLNPDGVTGMRETSYSVISENTEWTLGHAEGDTSEKYTKREFLIYEKNANGVYEFRHGSGLTDNLASASAPWYRPITISFASIRSFFATHDSITDTGNGDYLYSLETGLDSGPTYTLFFMWDEAEASRIQAEIDGGGQTPAFSSPSAPTVSGGAAITRANIGTLTEITVPVTYSGSTAQTVTFAVPFFDGDGRFVGVGMTTETVTSSTQSVTMPVSGLSGSVSMSVMFMNENLQPLSPAGRYSIPA